MESRKIHLDPNETVGEIAVKFPEVIPVFEGLKIDYCCGGSRKLMDACALAGLKLEDVSSAIEKSAGKIGSALAFNWKNKTMTELVDHILAVHHPFTRDQLGRLKILSEKVKTVHGTGHPELSRLDEIIGLMSEEMEGHMAKEEEQVFPYLKDLEKVGGQSDKVSNPFGLDPLNRHPLKVLMWEHGMTGEEWIEIGGLTNGLTVPSDACQYYRALFDGLKKLENDLHLHVHLENNVLFARAMEKAWLD